MGILDEIVLKKKERLNNAKSRLSVQELKTRIGERGRPRDFKAAVQRLPGETIKLIAEIEKSISIARGDQKRFRSGFRSENIRSKRRECGLHSH